MSAPEQRRGESQARETSPSAKPAVRGRRVLLVDDDDALRTLYRFNLEVAGVQVLEAADGETALRLIDGERPDAILLDVMMPGLDGWTVAERLAADPRTRELPVIFITARGEDAARMRGLGLGAAGYLTKPFNPVFLADEIEKILGAAGSDDRRAR
jgi:DNA-binding response OmpR family regulator